MKSVLSHFGWLNAHGDLRWGFHHSGWTSFIFWICSIFASLLLEYFDLIIFCQITSFILAGRMMWKILQCAQLLSSKRRSSKAASQSPLIGRVLNIFNGKLTFSDRKLICSILTPNWAMECHR